MHPVLYGDKRGGMEPGDSPPRSPSQGRSETSASRIRSGLEERSLPVTGAILIPMYTYGETGPEKRLRGKPCIFLGRENWGRYADRFNFFGGRVEKHENPLDALIQETAEELCLEITETDLDTCLVDLRFVSMEGYENEETMLVFAHMTGLSRGEWHGVMQQRTEEQSVRERVPDCLFELSDVTHCPVTEVLTRRDVSGFVKECHSHIMGACEKLAGSGSVAASDLELVVFSRPRNTRRSSDERRDRKREYVASDSDFELEEGQQLETRTKKVRRESHQ